VIARIIQHWILPDKVEQARELFRANSEAMRKIQGLICRYTFRSADDPLKWTTIAVWADEAAAKAWANSPDHIWDRYGQKPVIPEGTQYFRKYGPAGSVQAKPSVAEAYHVVQE
jgi:quinol monooxygenase YgiN